MSRAGRLHGVCLWLALVVGVAGRVAFLSDKPLWRDEAWVGTFIRQPWGDLFEGRGRPVPLGFAVLSKLMDAVPWPPEVALRLLPLAAGCLALPAVFALARRLGAGSPAALAALWLTAGAPVLVHYSRELKSYALDLLLAALVPWLVLRLLDEEQASGSTASRRAALFVVLAVAPWLSFGAVFPVAATLLWVGWGWARRRLDGRWLLPLLAFVASLGVAYLVSLGRQSVQSGVRRDWSDEMRPPSEAAGMAPAVALGAYLRASFADLVPEGVPPAAAALVVAMGCVTWPGRRRRLVWWLTGGTTGLTVWAALADLYPITQGRLLLFAAPLHLLLAGRGLAWLGEGAGRLLRRGGTAWAGVAVAAAVALHGTAASVRHRVHAVPNGLPRYYVYDVVQDVEPLIDQLVLLAAPSEPVITSRYSGDQFRFYARGRLPQAMVCRRTNCPEEGPRIREWLRTVDGRGWMVLLDEEDRPWRRRFVQQLGFDVREASAVRGAVLWEVRRRRPATLPAASGVR